MTTKAENPEAHLTNEIIHPIIRIYFALNHLKHIYRRGWLLNGIPKDICESVADHTFGVAFLALLLSNFEQGELDQSKLLKMALIHDVGEIDAGDIVPSDGMVIEEKSKMERNSILRIFSNLRLGENYIEIWDEFNYGKSAEANFIKQIDKLEMALQAMVYQCMEVGNSQEFLLSAKDAITIPYMEEILDATKNLLK